MKRPAGHVPGVLAPMLGALAERIPVVLTSRSGAGSVLGHTYGAVGSETDLQRRGLPNGGLLDPYKAKVLLRLLLARGAGRAEIAALLARRGWAGLCAGAPAPAHCRTQVSRAYRPLAPTRSRGGSRRTSRPLRRARRWRRGARPV